MKLRDELKKNNCIRIKIIIIIFRIGFVSKYESNNLILKNIFKFLYYILKSMSFVCQAGVLPSIRTYIDWGLCIPHGFKGIEINPYVKIGKNCTLYHNTTIGKIDFVDGIAEIGDNVYIGAHTLILGGTTIGDNCKIGAGSKIISKNIPSNSTVVTKYRVFS